MRIYKWLDLTFLFTMLVATFNISAADEQFVVNTNSTPKSDIAYDLPDISGYTPAEVKKKMAYSRTLKKGRVTNPNLLGQVEVRMLYAGESFWNIAKKQKNIPKSLTVKSGTVELDALHRAYPKFLVKEKNQTYLAKLPIVVGIGATLIIENATLKLSEDRGSFVSNGGTLYISNAKLVGWRESTNTPAFYTQNEKSFRPFVVGWGGSNTYISESVVSSLGYFAPKSFGLTLSRYKVKEAESMFQRKDFDFSKSPKGWFIHSVFEDIYYGFYCYEAEDIVIAHNVYRNNIIYGIDPHDITSHLIIANNEVYGTKVKHGIIISRDVSDSYIFNNKSYKNNKSGIMLDRSSQRNIIVSNKTFENGSDGITLYESGYNIIANNQSYKNKAHGIRVRNSQYFRLIDNYILSNKKFGVYIDTASLKTHLHRDLKLDPFETKSSGYISGGVIANNKSGSVYSKSSEFVSFYNLTLEDNGSNRLRLGFGGDIERFHNQIVKAMLVENKVVSLSKINEEAR
ncbi:NosD domain-containing protein [Moritella sp. Urea-trap-13]|uniref:NosD domain-containing protein n=1 Tax=Moritella sp. Urea-trap-13 TaxID=2058327 RepID=UPI000C328852|nr:NosD domain-containing protein [Moritella sp. Urea-trap-13]PKH07923.1 hypothetical protein CXF93_04325 [Moritella sp. Urea-trap-13]